MDIRTKQVMRESRGQRGQALVPVLFIVLILTALAATVTTSSRQELRAAGNQLAETQQYYVARGAINYAAAELQQVTNGGATAPQLTQPPDTDANGWTQLGEGWYKLEIIDTASRVNINTADLATLEKLPPFIEDPSIAAAIVDWRDADDMPGQTANGSGAESETYNALNPPYNAKNAPFDTVAEMLLVRGITPVMLYGVGGQIPAVPAGTPGSDIDDPFMETRAGITRQATGGTGGTTGGTATVDTTASTVPLSELVTTYSKERNVAADGTKRINIKTANAQAIQKALTDAGVSTAQARTVATTFTGGSAANGNRDERGQVTALGDLLGKFNGNLQVVTPWPRTVLQLVADKLAVTDSEYANGVVNINTAPPEVIATLPGVDQTLYNTLTTLKQQGTTFASINDLFVGTTFNATQLRALYGKVCTKSSVYLVRVKVRMASSPRIYAAQALVELAATPSTTDTSVATGTGATADTETAQTSSNSTILQFREVARMPGWTSWAPPPNYYTTSSSTVGGTVGNQ